MPVHNSDVATIFNRVADLLDIKGDNPFRIRAYRNAAQTVSSLSDNVADLVEEGADLSDLSGIGEDLAGKIEEIVKNGSLGQLDELESEIPGELSKLMKLDSLGPKRVKALHEELNIETIEDLKDAVKKEKIRELDGFGKKTEDKISSELEQAEKEGPEQRIKRFEASEYGEPYVEYLRELKGIKRIAIAGSYRRYKETVGDLDILVSCKRGTDVSGHFTSYEDVNEIIAEGKTKSSVRLRSGLQVDLRVVPHVSFGAALLYFTGSKAHNVEIRKRAVKDDLKINEYGVYKNDDRIAGKTEKEVYKKIGLPFIAPELRENRGEIEAAEKDALPDLVTEDDIRGDFHVHTKATDGKYSLKEMVEAARDRGYEYLAISDHSKRVTVANGMDEKRLRKQIGAIDKLNSEIKKIRILKSIEVDILEDGSLDLPDDVLKELDLVTASVHYNLKLSKKKQTKRVLRALDNPHLNILGHPTGRIINERKPYDIDLKEIMKAAKANGCYLEINAQPHRLDLSDIHAKMARDMGLKLAISTDAHSPSDMDNISYGIGQARRGWLEKKDVLNTYAWSDLKKMLNRS